MAVPSLRGYRGDRLRGDLVVGLSVWAVLVPRGAGLRLDRRGVAVVGLDAAPEALIVYAAIMAVLCLVIAFSA